jgi:hypothetical protein
VAVDLFIKAIVAFCIGAAAIYGAQTLWLSSVKQQIVTAERTPIMPESKPLPKFDASNVVKGLQPPKLDPNIGKNIPMGAINQQINRSIRAGDMVPRPPRIPGLRGR